MFNADHFPLWYKRAAEQVPGTFVYSIPFSTGTENATKPYMAGGTLYIKYKFYQLQNYSGFFAATWKPLEHLISWVTLHIKHILGTHLFLPNIPRVTDWDFYSFLPLLYCFSAAQCSARWRREHSAAVSRAFTTFSLLMTPLTTPLSPLLPEMTNHSKCFRVIEVIWLPGLRYRDVMDWRCKRLWGRQMSGGLHLVERRCHLKKCPSSLQL